MGTCGFTTLYKYNYQIELLGYKIMQSIGCCFDTGTTSFPLAASLTISVTFLKSGNAIVDSLEYTKVPLTDTSNVPVNTEQWIPVRCSKSAD